MSAKPKPKPASAPVADLAFEPAFAELDEIVNQLESADLPLERALALFERGQTLAAHCQALLDAAELKVHELSASRAQALED